jgi:Bacterial Ig-like domain
MSEINIFNSNRDHLPQLLLKSSKTSSPLEEPFGATNSSSITTSEPNSLAIKNNRSIIRTSTYDSQLVDLLLRKPLKRTYLSFESISEDTDISNDFKTSDNTLVFEGASKVGNEVEGFLRNIASGGQFSIGTTTTDKSGRWTIDYSQNPLSDGKYEVFFKATDAKGNVGNASLSELEIDTNYDIEFDFTDASIQNNIPLQSRIREAGKFWEDIIKNDILDENHTTHGFIDDLKIKFEVQYFDGLGGGLANTGGYERRAGFSGINDYDPITGKVLPNSSFLPSYAVITIDSADVNDILTTDYGLDTLKHEIAHAIGFNSGTFASKGLIDKFTYNPYAVPFINQYETYQGFKGENAVKVYHELGGNPLHRSVPLDADSPSHWNEWLFPDDSEFVLSGFWSPFDTDELMTTNPPNDKNDKVYLSKLTLAAFMDLGFTVDWNKADNIQVDPGTFGNPIAIVPYGYIPIV